MYFEEAVFGGKKLVDLSALPPRSTPIRYPDFSVVDGAGFSEHPSLGRVVQTDPRDASVEKGRAEFEKTVGAYLRLVEETLGRRQGA
jgi:creatinine amidohydrolase/Fe(II)-dependent formamide hydrolase-like protein